MVRRKRQVLGVAVRAAGQTDEERLDRAPSTRYLTREMSKPTARNLQFRARQSYRPTAFWSRSTVQVEAALATSRFSLSVISHST